MLEEDALLELEDELLEAACFRTSRPLRVPLSTLALRIMLRLPSVTEVVMAGRL